MLKFHGVPPKLDMFITQEQRVVIYCPLNAYSEEFNLSQELAKTTDPQPSNAAPKLSTSTDTVEQNGGKVLKFFPSDGHFETDVQHDEYAPSAEAYHQEHRIFGLVGILDLGFGKYLFYIKDRRWVALNGDKNIYQVVRGGHVTVFREPYLTLTQEQFETESIDGVLSILSSGQLFYSYDYDITNNSQSFFQRVQKLTETGANHAYIYSTANPDYWWNRYLQRDWLSDPEKFKEFIIPLVCGYVGHIATVLPFRHHTGPGDNYIADDDVDILLIARMRTRRVGTRYTRRGVDKNGNAAIHVESELVVRAPHKVASYVQIRASVPWFWCQIPNMDYKPKIKVEDSNNPEALAAMKAHFLQLKKIYNKNISCINLLDCEGFEYNLQKVYSEGIDKLINTASHQNVTYHAFDLNAKLPGLRMKDPMAKLRALKGINEVTEAEMCDQGVFLATINSAKHIESTTYGMEGRSWSGKYLYAGGSSTQMQVEKLQNGIFRTNCLDCLDRTNMIQFMVASSALNRIFKALGVASEHETTSDFQLAVLEPVLGRESIRRFRELWIAHGDSIATQYTGTGALHSNFIRYGHSFYSIRQRGQFRRKVRDGVLALTRYYLNQFADSFKQDAYDIFLGYHRGTLEIEKTPKTIATEAYAKTQQSLQRVQSFELINDVLYETGEQVTAHSSSISAQITIYFSLVLRHFPHQVKSVWDYFLVLFLLSIMGLWWIIVGKRKGWKLSRYPRSGNKCFEGDDTPLPIHEL